MLARAALLLALPGAAPAQEPAPLTREEGPRPPHIVLATVDGRELTLASALDTFLSSHMGHGVLVRGEPAVRDLAGRLVERELFLLEAEALGVLAEPQVTEIVAAYQRQTAADEYWRRHVNDRVQVTDEEVEAFYAKTDLALRLTLIESADRASAEGLRARVAAGEDMGKLARTESIHPSRTFDGSLQYVRRGELERLLEEAAFTLEEPGSLSAVVRTEQGFGFVRLEERSLNPERPPRETALPQIRGILEERAAKRLAAELEERAQADAGAWVDEQHLDLESVLDGPDAKLLVARAAGDSLTLQDVRDGLELDALRAAPERGGGAGLQLARQWVRSQSITAAAEKAGLLEDPVVVDKVTAFRKDVAMKFLCDRYVWPGTEPSEEDLRAHYEEHKERDYTTAPEARVAYIVVGDEAAARAVLARLANGEEFGQLAREISIDSASSVHGGRIGWVKPGELLPEVEERVFALAPGKLDGPISTTVGSFVVQVLERKEARVVPFLTARPAVHKSLTKERQSQAYAKWAHALRERADVVLDEQGLRSAVDWLEQQARRREADEASRPATGPGPGAPRGHGAGKPPRDAQPEKEGKKP